MDKFDEEYFNEYSFFLEKNKDLIKRLIHKNSIFFDDFSGAFEILDYIYSYLASNGKFYKEDDLVLFEYVFDYMVNLIEIFNELGVDYLFNVSNLVLVFELINLYNYNYALHLKIDDAKLIDLINNIEKTLKDYVKLMKSLKVNRDVINSIESLLLTSVNPIISEEEMPSSVLEIALEDIKRRK